MRYEFFFETADKTGAKRIATAHTSDDNAETMLINLIRGAGVNGMAGIPPVRDNVIRPLLRLTRDEVMAFIDERDILFVEDSTNELEIYTRNRIRNSIIPIIKEINPRFSDAAATAAEIFRADEEFISDIADLFIVECCIGLTADAADLATLPFSVGSRVIRKIYKAGITQEYAAGEQDRLSYSSENPISMHPAMPIGQLSHRHVKAVLELCVSDNPSASLSLPGMSVCREYERIVFGAESVTSTDEFAPVYLTDGDSFIILGLGLKITCKSVVYSDNIQKSARNHNGRKKVNKTFTTFLFKNSEICGKIAVRPRREGDSIKLSEQSGTKTLKKLFIEKRIPVRQRSLIPIICDDEGVLGIYGIGIGDRAIPGPGDRAIQIIIEEIST
jgi:tRNA(Ile)-lysidine synthase